MTRKEICQCLPSQDIVLAVALNPSFPNNTNHKLVSGDGTPGNSVVPTKNATRVSPLTRILAIASPRRGLKYVETDAARADGEIFAAEGAAEVMDDDCECDCTNACDVDAAATATALDVIAREDLLLFSLDVCNEVRLQREIGIEG